MQITKSDTLSEKQKEDIIQLWNDEYPEALALAGLEAFDIYLNTLSEKQHLTITHEGKVVGWLIYFVRDGEQCFAMLLDSSLQGKGLGSKLLSEAKEYTTELIGWVIDTDQHKRSDGGNYRSPIGFYEKNGFEVLPNIKTTKSNIEGIRVKWRKG